MDDKPDSGGKSRNRPVGSGSRDYGSVSYLVRGQPDIVARGVFLSIGTAFSDASVHLVIR